MDGEDTCEAEGEGAEVEKSMDRDGTGPVEAKESSEDVSEGIQLEMINDYMKIIHDQETLEHVDTDASQLTPIPQVP